MFFFKIQGAQEEHLFIYDTLFIHGVIKGWIFPYFSRSISKR